MSIGQGSGIQLTKFASGGVTYKGTLNASLGVYPSNPNNGDYYLISVAGTINGTHYDIGDWAIYNGVSWERLSGGNSATWGYIVGTLSNQTDLITYLSSNYYPTSNPSGYISNISGQDLSTANNVTSAFTTLAAVAGVGYLTSLAGALLATGATTGATSQSQVFTNGATLSNITSGSVLFAGTAGVVSQNNANFFWDNTDPRLGLGLNTPTAKLHQQTAMALYPTVAGANAFSTVGWSWTSTAPVFGTVNNSAGINDGNLGSGAFYGQNGVANGYLQLKLASAQSFAGLYIYNQPGNGATGYTWNIQYADDNGSGSPGSWTTITLTYPSSTTTFDCTTGGVGFFKALWTSVGSHVYWRLLNITASYANSVYEVQFIPANADDNFFSFGNQLGTGLIAPATGGLEFASVSGNSGGTPTKTTYYTMGNDPGDSNKFKIGTSSISTSPRLVITTAGNFGFGTKGYGNGALLPSLLNATYYAVGSNTNISAALTDPAKSIFTVTTPGGNGYGVSQFSFGETNGQNFNAASFGWASLSNSGNVYGDFFWAQANANYNGNYAKPEVMRLNQYGQLGLGVGAVLYNNQKATLTLGTMPVGLSTTYGGGGAGTAGTAPLAFIAGTVLATPIAGAMEYDGTSFYLSPSTTRYAVPLSTATYTLNFTTTANTALTLPTSGTLATQSYVTIANAQANSSITPVADGTYTVGAALTPGVGVNGTITTVKGIITAVQQAT